MCQFKTVAASAPDGGGGGRATCRCQGGAAAADALRQMPPELVERIFAPAKAKSQTPPTAMAEMAAELKVSVELDNNNNNNNNSKIKANCSSSSDALPRGNKRRVRFADDLGRSLTEVRLFESEPSRPVKPEAPLDLLLQCQFEQPSAELALRALLSPECSVRLSGLRLDPVGAGVVSLTGFALVKNLSYQKRVFVRITADRWRSFADLEADYAGSLDDQRDVFEFELRCEVEEVEFEFCVCLEAEGRGRLWDSNGGGNYRACLVKPKRATFSLWGEGEDNDSDEE